MTQASTDSKGRKRTFLIFSQVYPPDPASVGQHMHDVAKSMVARGWRVRVIAANRGYDDASIKYKNFEIMDGVEVRRVPFSSFGKKSIVLRAVAMGIFMMFCLYAGMVTRRLACILTSTSPPMCAFAAGVCHSVRRVPIKYWVMDLNPDQMIELGKMQPNSFAAKMLNALQRFVLKRSQHVVALDRFMVDRLNKKWDATDKLTIMPPWPHDEKVDVVEHADNWFREKHEMNGQFVFMYSGNHGYSTPVTTVLDAALEMRGDEDRDKLFMFIGGGVGKKEVNETIEKHEPHNIRSLPYQPFKDLKFSLSAADVHIVTVGPDVVGVVHPCKIYGAMAVARPILLVAPDPCHASDIVREQKVGWHIPHGDIEGAVRTLREIAETSKEDLAAMGQRGKEFLEKEMSKDVLCGKFCDIMEQGL